MKQIPLTKGFFALVDDEDFDLVNQFKWHYKKKPTDRTGYAVRAVTNTESKKPKQKTMFMHRFIMDLDFGDKRKVDHEDHNGLNNQKTNLRICDNQKNAWNQLGNKNSLSQYKGVTLYRNQWRAQIGHNKKLIIIGLFEEEKEAAIAYDREAQKLFGNFALLNFPDIERKPTGQILKNTRLPKNNTTGFSGVSPCSKTNKFQVQIYDKGKRVFCGRFSDVIEAAKSYDKKVKELGLERRLNFPDEKYV